MHRDNLKSYTFKFSEMLLELQVTSAKKPQRLGRRNELSICRTPRVNQKRNGTVSFIALLSDVLRVICF